MDRTDFIFAFILLVAILLSINARFENETEDINELFLKTYSYQLDILKDQLEVMKFMAQSYNFEPTKIAINELNTALKKNTTPAESLYRQLEDAGLELNRSLSTSVANFHRHQRELQRVENEFIERIFCYFNAVWEFLVFNTLLQGYKNPGWKKMAFLLLSPYIKMILYEAEISLLPSKGNLNLLEYYKRFHRVDGEQLAFLLNKLLVPPVVTDILSIVLHVAILRWWYQFLREKVRLLPSRTPTRRSNTTTTNRRPTRTTRTTTTQSAISSPRPPTTPRMPITTTTTTSAARAQTLSETENMNTYIQFITLQAQKVFKPGNKKPVRSRLNKGQDSFFHACLYGHRETVLAILANSGTAIEIATLEPFTGQTAFHLACIKGHLSILHHLMNKFGTEVCNSLKSRNDLTGLEVAAEHGRSDIVHAILRSTPRKTTRKSEWLSIAKSALKLSIQNDHFESAKKIYSHLGDPKCISREPYFDIYFKRFYDISSYLANHSVSRNTKEQKHREKQVANKDVYKNYICYILQENQPNSDGTAASAPAQPSPDEEDLDCPVCFEFMCKPRMIFSCYNGHLLCSICLACPKIQSCPLCRDDFKARKPKRNLAAEEKAKRFEHDG